MTAQRRQVIIATTGVTLFFALYETVKTVLFPAMDVITSHIITTIVVSLLTLVTAHFIVQRLATLLGEREQSNQRLREALSQAEHSSNLLRSIVESVTEGLVITDRDANVLLVNDAARSLLNLSERPLARLPDVSRDPQVHRVFNHALNQGERAEARIETRDTSTQNRRSLRLQAAPLRLREGQINGVVGAFVDISQLERLEQVRQEFLANVSHELRTPLAAITAYVETLLDGGLNDGENCLRFLHTIHRNAERMRALVNDIAELSAIEAGNVQLALEAIPLQLFVNEIFSHLAPRATKYEVTLTNQVNEELCVFADRRRLEQIFINLIDNAIKFNRPGGSVIVSTALSERGNHHLIRVRDTGIGIPADALPRVFERFYRVDKARSRAAGGTGLGLAIVKHLALAHGGEASVISTVGEGSEFTIKLPVRAPLAESADETKPESKALAGAG
jgi:two-component system, OmpR family, phosphate regulon sensor histidine kinase PhoR